VDPLTLARWQFGTTTIYHFLFVPLTIGLALVVAIMQTMWHRTDNPTYLRMTKFWGKLLLINFALGVVTGIVQEFQFGMNWSDYSRFVGDIFGAPLAMEGLIAFFLESTFLGLWIFGWDRLPRRMHLASIWMVAIGTTISAAFILAANSWMQHPVGFTINEELGRAELTSFVAVLTNPTLLIHFPHTIFSALVTAGVVVVAVSGWHLLRRNEVDLFHRSMKIGLAFVFVAGVLVAFTGHTQAQVMTDQQPMKMAAAEALWDTEQPAGFSIFAVGDREGGRNSFNLVVPNLLSVLSTNSLDGEVRGINDIQAEYEATFGPGNYIPNVGVVYWSFRIMVGSGFALILLSGIGLWLMFSNRLVESRWFLRLTLPALALPFLANSTGWLLTEMGRQPWVVHGVLLTEDGVSPSVGGLYVLITLVGFTLLYGVLAVADVWLMRKYAIAGPTEETTPEAVGAAFTY